MSIANLVPLPKSVQRIDGPYLPVTGAVTVAAEPSEGLDAAAARVKEALQGGTGEHETVVELEVQPSFAVTNPDLVGLDGSPSDESYRIEVDGDRIRITAPSELGLLRASSTLRQLVETNKDGSLGVPQCLIEDAPRFKWRGISMDVSRSFYTTDEMKKLIDVLAFYRMNTLHMHLSDDQGWRLEVPSLPLLTEISGKTAGQGGRPGFYTTEEFRDLVKYAGERGVSVVPEFDMPGHTNAAAHAYGELMPDGVPTEAYTGTKVGFSKLYPEIPFTSEFIKNIFNTACEEAGGDYVHVGGDEALVQSSQDYKVLVEEAADAVIANGKKVVGWQEVANLDLPVGSVVQYWNHTQSTDPIVDAVGRGYQVLMSPTPHAYFDMRYDDSTPYGQEWGGHIELAKAYGWDPSTQIEGVEDKDIIGVEAGMWTEYIHDLDALMYMLLPRIPAIAEVGWSAKDRRDLEGFENRIASHPEYWDAASLKWHRSPGVDWVK